jgi:signal transduction histidine kinase
MDLEKLGRRALLLWVAFGLLVALIGALGFLQYRWTGAISVADNKRLRESLNASLESVRRDFNSEIGLAITALVPTDAEVESLGRQAAYEARFTDWKLRSSHTGLFKAVAIAGRARNGPFFQRMDQEHATLAPAEWPESWTVLREFVESRLNGAPPQQLRLESTTLIDVPRFRERFEEGPGFPKRRPGEPGRPPREGGGEQDWLLLEVDPAYASGLLLPELLSRHLGSGFRDQYVVEVAARGNLSDIVFRSDGEKESLAGSADAAVVLFDVNRPPGRGGPGFKGPGAKGPPPGGPGDRNSGRWQLSVRARTGSLDAVVANARMRNMAVAGGILLLLLLTSAALVRFSRQAHRLAEVEMEFVAGVSHELRTPLTVIRTAAFNLRGKLASNPAQVERYGALIQNESEKLTAIVEQVLRFASAKGGQVIRERKPVSVEALIQNSLHASKGVLEDTLCSVEKIVEPRLPQIPGDSLALQHALQNLINNAVKYGVRENRWIGISARAVPNEGGPAVEIRVQDRGPGIPAEEQRHIFEPFFRGAKAVRDQVHGTGLGLNLVKKIVEAHGGTVRVESQVGAGASFILRLPAGPGDVQHELQHSLG